MALNPTTIEAVVSHLQEKWGQRNCPMCMANTWMIHGNVILGLNDDLESIHIGGPSLPCAAVMCRNCGNTILVNLLIAGVKAPANV